jgi:signal transduction histidine kinase/CheY-like chemotaxis protein
MPRLPDSDPSSAAAQAAQAGLRDRLQSLVMASGSLLTSPRVENALPAMLQLAEALMPADGYAVWRLNRLCGVWNIGAWRGVSEEFASGMIQSPEDAGALTSPFGEGLVAADVHAVPLLEKRREIYRREGIASLLAVPLTISGQVSGTFVFYYRDRHDFTEVETQTGAAFGNLASAALTTAELYDEQRLRHEQAAFLAEASAVLGTSLEYLDTLKRVAELAVPHIADWCAVDLVGEGGQIERLAVAHVDPAMLELARQIEARYPADADSPHSVQAVIRTGSSSMLSDISDDTIIAAARGNTDRVNLVRALGLTSYMCVPLRAHGRTLGALTFMSAESRRRYTQADLQFAENIAGRAALAVDNARAYEEARRANQLKDEFLATLSHELRTPLNAIVGYARMLETGVIAPDRRAAALKILDRNATTLTQIVEDVLDVSRIVLGKVRLDVRSVDLSTVLRDTVATMRLAADAKGISLKVAIAPRPGQVAGDPDRLRQVVWNLLSNAVKFTPGGGRIEVRLESGPSHVEVVVSDTGIGLEAAFIPHLFERFRQADGRLSREHGGLGLGLAISRYLVEMHGGTIAAESEGEGRGATFRVRLPVTLAVPSLPVEGGAMPSATETMAASTPLARLDGVRVVAVDDEEDALGLLREVLETAGASVSAVQSPASALAVVERIRPDVLITDIGMPGMDGFELLAKIRQSAMPEVSRVPAAALTAYARSEDRLRALRAGFQIHLAKPIDPAELVAAVRMLARQTNV